MKAFDKALNSIYKIFNKIIFYFKKITRVEIIKRLEKVKKLIDDDNIKQAKLNINYIVDDIFMYKNNCL